MDDIEKVIEIIKTAGYLKRIRRTGWVRLGIADAESVGDHSFRTALMCMFLGTDTGIDRSKMIEMALIHDLGESATSDIRHEQGVLVLTSEEAKNKIEEEVLKTIFSPLKNGTYYLSLWYEFRDQSTKEAQLVKQIEKIEMALQAIEYSSMGTPKKLIEEFLENADKYVTDERLKNLLEMIIKEKS